MKKYFVLWIIFMMSSPVYATPLISAKEAALPDASGALTTRGIARGPSIKLVSPDNGQAVSSPFDLKLAFQARGEGKIDVDSVKVFYVKATPIDLTERLKKGITKDGLEFSKAEIPPGKHTLRVNVKDVEGHETNTFVTLVVEK
jgi:hypothetical protein